MFNSVVNKVFTYGAILIALCVAGLAVASFLSIGAIRTEMTANDAALGSLDRLQSAIRKLADDDGMSDSERDLAFSTYRARYGEIDVNSLTVPEARQAIEQIDALLAPREPKPAPAQAPRARGRAETGGVPNDAVRAALDRSAEASAAIRARQSVLADQVASGWRRIALLAFLAALAAILPGVLAMRFEHELAQGSRDREAARQKDERYRMLVEHASDGIFIIDTQRNIVDANASACALLARMRDDIIGMRFRDAFADESSAAVLRRMDGMTVGETVVAESTLKRRDGTRILVETSAKMAPDGRIQAIVRDITERRREEAAQRQREELERRQHTVLLRLGKLEMLTQDGLGAAFREITQAVSEAMDVTRVSIWLFDDSQKNLRCENVFDRNNGRHSKTGELSSAAYPGYIQSLLSGRIIAAADAVTDTRTADLAHTYLLPHCVPSILCAPIRSGVKVEGAICFEHVGAQRQWLQEEQTFASSIADLVSLTTEQWERVQAQEALLKSEKYYRSLIENSSDIITILDSSAAIRYVSPSVARLLGYKPEILNGRRMIDFIHPDDLATVESTLATALRTPGKSVNVECRLQHQDGTWRICDTAGANLLEDSTVAGIVLNTRDVTDRKAIERELAVRVRLANFGLDVSAALTRGETLPSMLRQCSDAMCEHLGGAFAGIWTYNPREDVLELQSSSGTQRLAFAVPQRVPVGRSGIGIIAYDRQPRMVDFTSNSTRPEDREWAARTGLVSFAGYPLVVEDRLVGVMALFAATSLSNTTLVAMSSVADEIALGIDHTNASDALRASEVRFRSIVTNALDGIVTLDGNARIESYNAAARSVFEYEQEEILGKHVEVLIPDLGHAPGRDRASEIRHKAVGKVTEWEGRRKDGSRFPVELSIYEFEIPDGRYFAMSVRDVSERREVDRLKKEFVSTVSHELRTPLTSIRGSLSLLAAGVLGDLPEEAQEVIDVAERNTNRLVTLINDILDLDRLESGKMEMHLEPVSFDTVQNRSVEAIRAFAEQSGVTLTTDFSSVLVHGDCDRLVQVLVNLLSNAIKFSPSGSMVSLEAFEGPGYGELRVTDQGRGIPSAFLEAIFEPFKQVEGSDSREKGGTGLGLAICKAIIDQHRGQIGVESVEGAGSTFWFRIPSASSWRAILKQHVSSAILIRSSDREALVRYESILGEAGFEQIRSVTSTVEAWDALQREPISLLVLDVDSDPEAERRLLDNLATEQRLGSLPILLIGSLDPMPVMPQSVSAIASPATDRNLLESVLQVFERGSRSDVLLVDDDEAILNVMKRQLLQEHIAVRTATSGKDAVVMARQDPPGVLVLDVGLPEGDGYDVIDALRREPRLKRIPLLVYTGRDLTGDERLRLKLGPTRFLTKSKATDEEFRMLVVDLLKQSSFERVTT